MYVIGSESLQHGALKYMFAFLNASLTNERIIKKLLSDEERWVNIIRFFLITEDISKDILKTFSDFIKYVEILTVFRA